MINLFYIFLAEPYLEAIPTIHILLALYVRNKEVFNVNELNYLGISKMDMSNFSCRFLNPNYFVEFELFLIASSGRNP